MWRIWTTFYPILLYTLSFEEIDGQLADYFNFKMGV
jgi:hypothetical protein